MGQDTCCDISVSVTLDFTMENAKLIHRLAQKYVSERCNHRDHHRIHCFISNVGRDGFLDDEVYEWTEHSLRELDVLPSLFHDMMSSDNDSIENVLKNAYSHYFHRLRFIFYIAVLEPYVRNISRRYNPSVFHQTSLSVSDLSNKMNECHHILSSLGVPDHLIKMGYHFTDSW